MYSDYPILYTMDGLIRLLVRLRSWLFIPYNCLQRALVFLVQELIHLSNTWYIVFLSYLNFWDYLNYPWSDNVG